MDLNRASRSILNSLVHVRIYFAFKNIRAFQNVNLNYFLHVANTKLP